MVYQIVKKAATATTVACDRNPAPTNTPVHLKVTVGVVAPGAGTPTGKVVFKVNGVKPGTVTLQPDGSATISLTRKAGKYQVIALYKGDAWCVTSKCVVLVQKFTK